MSSHAQLLNAKSLGRRQFWYINGTDLPLMQDAYDLAASHVCLEGLEVEKRVFLGSETSSYELQNALTQQLHVDRRLVVLLEAELFNDWEAIIETVRTCGPEVFFVAVAEEAKTLNSSLNQLSKSTKAKFVTCKAPTPDELSLWITSRLNINSEAVMCLLENSNSDTAWLLNQLRKLERVPAPEIDASIVKAVCRGTSRPDFTTYLTSDLKAGALTALENGLPAGEISRLTQRLSLLILVKEAVAKSEFSNRLMVEYTGLSPKQIDKYRPTALKYNREKGLHAATALIKLEKLLRTGSKAAVMALVSRW